MTTPKVLIESMSNLAFRDLAALVAMHGMVSSLQENETLNTSGTAAWAYEMADALIEAADAVPEEEVEMIDFDMSVNPNDEEIEIKTGDEATDAKS